MKSSCEGRVDNIITCMGRALAPFRGQFLTRADSDLTVSFL